MKRFLACLLLLVGLWAGAAVLAQAQRGRIRGYYQEHNYAPPAPPVYYRAPVPRPYYNPRSYSEVPYRSYGRQYYYWPLPSYQPPGPAIIIRP